MIPNIPNRFKTTFIMAIETAWLIVGITVPAFALPENLRLTGGFTEADGILTSPASGELRLATTSALLPGYYVFSAEYRTEGFDPLGKFAFDVKKQDRSANLSAYEWVSAAPDWTPLTCYFRVPDSAVAQFRLCDWKQAGQGAKVQFLTWRSRHLSLARGKVIIGLRRKGSILDKPEQFPRISTGTTQSVRFHRWR